MLQGRNTGFVLSILREITPLINKNNMFCAVDTDKTKYRAAPPGIRYHSLSNYWASFSVIWTQHIGTQLYIEEVPRTARCILPPIRPGSSSHEEHDRKVPRSRSVQFNSRFRFPAIYSLTYPCPHHFQVLRVPEESWEYVNSHCCYENGWLYESHGVW